MAQHCYVECHYAECRFAECHFVECRGAILNLPSDSGPMKMFYNLDPRAQVY